MLEAPSHTAFFGDGEKTFRLTPPMVLELERTTGVGIGGLSRRVFSSEYRHADLLEIVRLALVGGGTGPKEAAALVGTYAAPAPVVEVHLLALTILEATMFGAPVKKGRRK